MICNFISFGTCGLKSEFSIKVGNLLKPRGLTASVGLVRCSVCFDERTQKSMEIEPSGVVAAVAHGDSLTCISRRRLF